MVSMSNKASLHDVIRRAHLRMAWVSISLAGVLLLFVGLGVLRLYVSDNLQLVARSLAYTVEASLVFGDREEAGRVLEQMLRGEGVSHARVLDAQGELFVQWVAHGPAVTERLGTALAASMGLSPGEAAVMQGSTAVGSVQLHSDGGGLVRFLGAGLVVLFLGVGVSGYVGLRQSRRMLADIGQPLQELAKVARAVRHDRSMEQRVGRAHLAELRELGDDFNALLAELQMRHQRLEQQNSALTRQTQRDALTGLANRPFFEQRLVRAMEEFEASGRKLAVLFLDLDRFKQVNDMYGHAAGDALLKVISMRLKAQVRESDLVARLGGDEFVALLEPVRGVADAEHVVEKIQQAIQEPLLLSEDVILYPALSVGVAIYPDDGRSLEDLMEHADRRMYVTKAKQRKSIGV